MTLGEALLKCVGKTIASEEQTDTCQTVRFTDGTVLEVHSEHYLISDETGWDANMWVELYEQGSSVSEIPGKEVTW